jgi:hypothetical protein
MTRSIARTLAVVGLALTLPLSLSAQRPSSGAADSLKYVYPASPELEALKAEAARRVDAKAKLVQEMVDQVFSYGELGMQEFETSKYLTGIL